MTPAFNWSVIPLKSFDPEHKFIRQLPSEAEPQRQELPPADGVGRCTSDYRQLADQRNKKITFLN